MPEVRKFIVWSTLLVGVLIVIGSLLLSVTLTSMKLPPPPELTTDSSLEVQQAKKEEIANYKELVAALQNKDTNIYDFVVIKTLLALFSALITGVALYVFSDIVFKIYDKYMDRKKVT